MQTTGQEKSTLVIAARETLSVSCVREVTGFDETQIEADTSAGFLLIRGSKLKIDGFNTDTGELQLSGRIDGLVYCEREQKRGFFSRLLK